jgi:NADP-dependent 3-hydroxy acid dehydrogenase YdfG
MNRPGVGVAVVSGAGSGIGREIALALARRGRSLALVGRRAAPLARVLGDSGARGLVLELDVRDAAGLAAAALRVESELGPVEEIVPAAGVASVAPFLETPAAEFEAALATNLTGVANLARAFLPAMLERRRGALVALLSVASRRAFPGWSAYCSSKHGLLGLVEVLREELAGTGLRVIAVTPGATASPLWNDLPGEWDRSRMIPAAEVARAVLWALDADPGVAVEEIRLRPPGGDL